MERYILVTFPDVQEFMEEDWFYEGIIETYIPLLKNFQYLVDNNIDFRVTMSITPPLCEMFTDSLLQDRFI